jgi:hypothetical protein
MDEQPEGPDLEAAHIEYITGDRPIDEVYETIRDVEQDPIGALITIKQLVAEVARLREALEHSKTGWENVIELELLDPAHDFTASGLLYEARAALAHGEADQ